MIEAIRLHPVIAKDGEIAVLARQLGRKFTMN